MTALLYSFAEMPDAGGGELPDARGLQLLIHANPPTAPRTARGLIGEHQL
ncbi:hypothetical protein HU735_03230 [Pseudomonas sp. BW16M2]|nr:hypothetical protein [Pseudomonas sp. BW16M2]MBC3434415.1 hypothetical protein [Pseudomonas sp. BW16M2]